MIELPLHCHPATPGAAVRALRVRLAVQQGGGLSLDYLIDADPGQLAFAPPEAPQRRDELWRHSCFELFVATAAGGYREFNFSPSGAWAIYEFSGYRTGMQAIDTPAPPTIARDARGLQFSVSVGAPLLQGLRAGEAALAVTAVIEDAAAQLSYWSLNHPPGRPDFHHRDGFVVAWPLAGAAATATGARTH